LAEIKQSLWMALVGSLQQIIKSQMIWMILQQTPRATKMLVTKKVLISTKTSSIIWTILRKALHLLTNSSLREEIKAMGLYPTSTLGLTISSKMIPKNRLIKLWRQSETVKLRKMIVTGKLISGLWLSLPSLTWTK
jgi:hypothetical protein